jgi:hypothetical protein
MAAYITMTLKLNDGQVQPCNDTAKRKYDPPEASNTTHTQQTRRTQATRDDRKLNIRTNTNKQQMDMWVREPNDGKTQPENDTANMGSGNKEK